jgi:hypothetical protein
MDLIILQYYCMVSIGIKKSLVEGEKNTKTKKTQTVMTNVK